jgi:hypothetical protein
MFKVKLNTGEELMKEFNIKVMLNTLKLIKSDLDYVAKTLNGLDKQGKVNKKKAVVKPKRAWMNYKLPPVLYDATKKRSMYFWKDLTQGSKHGFRHNILLWALPKVNNTYKKRIKTILNQYYA